jgi:hypothetical protein
MVVVPALRANTPLLKSGSARAQEMQLPTSAPSAGVEVITVPVVAPVNVSANWAPDNPTSVNVSSPGFESVIVHGESGAKAVGFPSGALVPGAVRNGGPPP